MAQRLATAGPNGSAVVVPGCLAGPTARPWGRSRETAPVLARTSNLPPSETCLMPHAFHLLFRRTLPATVVMLAACGGTPGGTPSPSSPAPEPVERQVAAPLDSAELARATLVRSVDAMRGREAAMRLRGFEI